MDKLSDEFVARPHAARSADLYEVVIQQCFELLTVRSHLCAQQIHLPVDDQSKIAAVIHLRHDVRLLRPSRARICRHAPFAATIMWT